MCRVAIAAAASLPISSYGAVIAMQVRPLKLSDYPHWLRLFKGYQTFYETSLDDAVSAITWGRFFDPAEPMHAAVIAGDDDVPFGIVHYIYHRSCWTVGDYCYLQDLFVDPQLRSKGAGAAMISYVYEQAKAAGASRVHWLTHQTNLDAQRLYDRVSQRSGFIQFRQVF